MINYRYIDNHIRTLVKKLNALGIETRASCAGYGPFYHLVEKRYYKRHIKYLNILENSIPLNNVSYVVFVDNSVGRKFIKLVEDNNEDYDFSLEIYHPLFGKISGFTCSLFEIKKYGDNLNISIDSTISMMTENCQDRKKGYRTIIKIKKLWLKRLEEFANQTLEI